MKTEGLCVLAIVHSAPVSLPRFVRGLTPGSLTLGPSTRCNAVVEGWRGSAEGVPFSGIGALVC
jgi:hypothetical protein